MARTWTSKSRYSQHPNVIQTEYPNVLFVYRQNDGNEMVNIAYTRHHSTDEEATDHDVPPKQYKKIRFNKETHPLSLMVLHTTCSWPK